MRYWHRGKEGERREGMYRRGRDGDKGKDEKRKRRRIGGEEEWRAQKRGGEGRNSTRNTVGRE